MARQAVENDELLKGCDSKELSDLKRNEKKKMKSSRQDMDSTHDQEELNIG